MTKEEYWFWLCSSDGIWQQDIDKIFNIYEGPEELFLENYGQIEGKTKLIPSQIRGLCESRESGIFLKKLEKLKKDGIKFLFPESPDYPNSFLLLDHMPYSMFVKGNLPSAKRPCVGMVGARACSGYGKENATKIAKALGVSGIQVISGLARGIDSYSAKGAIAGGGKTFAVLGSGIDVIYPPENIELYYEIITTGGGIISEYPPGTQPIGWQFPHRNRLISAFSDILVVVEAAIHSGTLTTASWALDQGKTICAVPGRIGDRLSVGCNRLIADGAEIFLNTETLVDEIYASGKWELPEFIAPEKFFLTSPWNVDTTPPNVPVSPPNSSKIYRLLGAEPQDVRDLMEKSKLNAEEVTSALAELEIDGLALQVSSDFFVKSC